MTGADIAEDSIGDIDVATRNAEFFRLLRHQPIEFVEWFTSAALAREKETVLRHRYARFRRLAHDQFSRIEPLAPDADRLAGRWADYRFERDTAAIRVMLRLGGEETDRDHIEVDGAGILDEIAAAGQTPLFVSAHWEAYQALPLMLAALGYRTSFLMDGGARSLAENLFASLAPDLVQRLTPVPAQRPMVARELAAELREGNAVLMYPEFAFGSSRYPTTSFFGREVYTPPGAEAIARMAGAPVVPVLLEEAGGRHRLTVSAPLWSPGEEAARGVVTRRVFRWLETTVARDPARWWCWEIFEALMATATEPAASS